MPKVSLYRCNGTTAAISMCRMAKYMQNHLGDYDSFPASGIILASVRQRREISICRRTCGAFMEKAVMHWPHVVQSRTQSETECIASRLLLLHVPPPHSFVARNCQCQKSVWMGNTFSMFLSISFIVFCARSVVHCRVSLNSRVAALPKVKKVCYSTLNDGLIVSREQRKFNESHRGIRNGCKCTWIRTWYVQ